MSNVIYINDHNCPNKGDLQTFMHVVFSGCSGLIPLRSFAEKGNKDSRPISNMWIQADDEMVAKALDFASLANKRQATFYVIPGTVAKTGQASSGDVVEMQVLLIDIDDGDTEAKLAALTATLGEPTMIVESGGITKEGRTKLHIYWQLTNAVSGDELQNLLQLRYKIALAFGGDTHFKSAHQPIRVAGSVYHKGGENRLVKIRSYNPIEYELEELTASVSCLPTLNNNAADNSFKAVSCTAHPLETIFTSKVHEGSEGESTRFTNLQRIIGYWLRRCHDGLITQEQAIEEIHSYNLANVIPSWPIERIKQTVDGLWRLHIQKYGEAKKVENRANDNVSLSAIKSFSLDSFLADTSKLPEDIIAPRILTPGGIFVFGGAPKVGKSDFLLSLFVHMAAGKEFLGFVPPRPLKIFYFQAEIGYHYLRERLQNMRLSEELLKLAKDNLQITPNSKMLLDEHGINSLAEHIKATLSEAPDIIAVDPIRNVFDGGRAGATENENDAMMFFLQKRIELLRDKVNPEAGIILAHHTKKISSTTFDEDPFQAFSGASSLRSYYTSGALLYRPEIENNELQLIFELRNGAHIPSKILNKKDGAWRLESVSDRRLAFKTQGKLYDRERERRIKVIVNILEAEALKGKFYLMKQFGEKFRNTNDLGNKRAICDDCSSAATKGIIKFFDNPEDYGLKLTNLNPGLGFMCTQNMRMCISKAINTETGEISENHKMILPTHYKRDCDGKKEKVVNPEIWQIETDEIEAKNAI